MRIQQLYWDSGTWKQAGPGDETINPQLVLLFGSREAALDANWIAQVRARYPRAQVVGCTTGGEILGRRVTDKAGALTAIQFDHTTVRTAHTVVSETTDSQAAGRQLIQALEPKGLRHVFILSEGLSVNGSDLLVGVNELLPPGVSVSGGFAADGNRFKETFVWRDSGPLRSAAVAIGFYGERLRIGVSATGGWGPFGPDRLITRSHKNLLYEVDGRPALALFKEYLGDYASQLPSIGLMFPMELRNPKTDARVLRSILGVNEADQSMTFAGNMPQGWFTRFMVGDIEDLISGAQLAAQKSLPALGGVQPELSLIVSCNARRAVLKQRVEEEIESAVDALQPSKAVVGFYSYGEIGPSSANCPCELFNETMTITCLSEV